jgi:hypothetical protein
MDVEPFAQGVEGTAAVLTFAPVCAHEPRCRCHAARQRVPAIQVDTAVEKDLGGNNVSAQRCRRHTFLPAQTPRLELVAMRASAPLSS